jgi:hypothetical protein
MLHAADSAHIGLGLRCRQQCIVGDLDRSVITHGEGVDGAAHIRPTVSLASSIAAAYDRIAASSLRLVARPAGSDAGPSRSHRQPTNSRGSLLPRGATESPAASFTSPANGVTAAESSTDPSTESVRRSGSVTIDPRPGPKCWRCTLVARKRAQPGSPPAAPGPPLGPRVRSGRVRAPHPPSRAHAPEPEIRGLQGSASTASPGWWWAILGSNQ